MSRTNETRFIEWHETCKCKTKKRQRNKDLVNLENGRSKTN